MDLSSDIFFGEVSFIRGVSDVKSFPETNLPEFAFVGRSNVGKSSLINALVSRNKLARVSNTPGRTREINLFNVADRFCIADLPGYGYAVISKSARAKWDFLIKSYLRGRRQLTRVFLLIDARFGYKDIDKETMKLLDEAAVSYQTVLTKIDKVSNLLAVKEKILETNKKFIAAHPVVISTSSKDKVGIMELRSSILEIMGNYA